MKARGTAQPPAEAIPGESLRQVGDIIKHATQGAADGISALSASLAAMSVTIASGQEQLRVSERARSELAAEISALRAQNLEVQRAADAAKERAQEMAARELRYSEMFKIAGVALHELVPSLKAMMQPKLGGGAPSPAAAQEQNAPVTGSLDDQRVEVLAQMVVGALSHSTLLAIQKEAGPDLMAALLRKINNIGGQAA